MFKGCTELALILGACSYGVGKWDPAPCLGSRVEMILVVKGVGGHGKGTRAGELPLLGVAFGELAREVL